ncbi:hypothetical protein P154DRAFT_619895 [Amniculicola lignicola CBS 123094]|uniref:VWFA domain-containing protein n=1 Tax=Amniculicola lignicola CBS 123094 TaxID=1392246 RepID=A0A6A5WKH3_9PLEO|nr:hypothetical protein P154DRAFT_619895 [Amniculicola lignicola CBS 123094]
MRSPLPLLTFLCWGLLATSSRLVSRGLPKCKTLEAESNNGGRKIAIVIDESGSMVSNDPYNLRIGAGKAVNDWLISSGEAGGDKKADLVSVIGFDYSARLYYPLGDPSGANKALDNITILGGTYIAGGVEEAISELTKSGHGPTTNRSGIVVFTDGADSDTITLVEKIDKAGQEGIRVSFGFLQDLGYGYQDPDILNAILGTGGMYATINGATAQNAFANLMIVHGLTGDDNPEPQNSTTVYNGLSIAFTLDSSGRSTVVYSAESNEDLIFTFASVAAGDLNITAVDANGKELNKTTVEESLYRTEELHLKAQSTGGLQIKVEGEPNQENALFTVGVNSSIPLTNCTLEQPKSSGLSAGAKAGIGVSVPLLAGLLGLGSYFAWKYWKGLPSKAPPGPAPDAPPMDTKAPYVHTTDVQPAHTPGTEYPNYNQVDPNQQPFNQQNPSHPQVDPSHPTQSDPMHPTEKDSYPHQPDPSHHPATDSHPHQPNSSHHPATDSHPHQPDPSHPPQADPSHPPGTDSYPNQPDPSHHPTTDSHPHQPDPSHPPQADPSHPTQADPSHPTQADPSHPTQTDPSHPPQADPSHPTQADPSHPTQTDHNPYPPQTDSNPNPPPQGDPSQPPMTDTNPNQPQGDPNQPPQQPTDPQDNRPKRIQTPRFPFRFFGRRRKKDDKENQNQQQNQQQNQNQHPSQQQTGYPQPQVQYSGQPATSSYGVPPNNQAYYNNTPQTQPMPAPIYSNQGQYIDPKLQAYPAVSVPGNYPAYPAYPAQQSSSSPPPQPYQYQYSPPTSGPYSAPSPQQYPSSQQLPPSGSQTSGYYTPGHQTVLPGAIPQPQPQYSQWREEPPAPQSRYYASTQQQGLPASYPEDQQPYAQGQPSIPAFPQPPPSAGTGAQRMQEQSINRGVYNVSPLQRHAVPSPQEDEQQQQQQRGGYGSPTGSVARKPVTGGS